MFIAIGFVVFMCVLVAIIVLPSFLQLSKDKSKDNLRVSSSSLTT